MTEQAVLDADAVTVQTALAVLIGTDEIQNYVFLTRQEREPYSGKWALPDMAVLPDQTSGLVEVIGSKAQEPGMEERSRVYLAAAPMGTISPNVPDKAVQSEWFAVVRQMDGVTMLVSPRERLTLGNALVFRQDHILMQALELFDKRNE